MRNFDYSTLRQRDWPEEIPKLLDLLKQYAQFHRLQLQSVSAPPEPCDLHDPEAARLRGRYLALQQRYPEALLDNILASCQLSGLKADHALLSYLQSDDAEPNSLREQEIFDYLRLHRLFLEHYAAIPFHGQTIVKMHYVLHQSSALPYRGRFRSRPFEITKEQLLSGTEGGDPASFVSLPPQEVPAAFTELTESCRVNLEQGGIEPLLLIPCFILDLLCLHPFADGNGRLGRVLTQLLFAKCGYEVVRCSGFDTLLMRDSQRYYDALTSSAAHWPEGSHDPGYFVSFLLRILLRCYEDFNVWFYSLEDPRDPQGRMRKAQEASGLFAKHLPAGLAPGNIPERYRESLAAARPEKPDAHASLLSRISPLRRRNLTVTTPQGELREVAVLQRN